MTGTDVGRRAVFLDRDGVLNEVVDRDGHPGSPRKLDEFRLVEGAAAAVRSLHHAGFGVYVATNQPDIGRGLLSQQDLDAMSEQLLTTAGVDAVRVCPHDDGDGCDCRKPLPGLLEQHASAFGLRLPGSYMVGDSWRDMEAGRAAGCRTVLLRTWYNEDATADMVVDTLAEAADWIVERERHVRADSPSGEDEGQ